MYNRVVLKLSGEALSNGQGAYDAEMLKQISLQIKDMVDLGIEVAVVVGGGNLMRGKQESALQIDRVSRDYMGMLATVMNAIAIQGSLEALDVETRVQTAIEMRAIAEPYILRRAIRHLEKGRVVIFGAGTGSPFFSTDTLAALRASEIKADVILFAKNGVDGVYDSDPKHNKDAVKYDKLTYMEMIQKNLQVMDTTATSMCMENDIDLLIFNINEPGNILKAALQQVEGTIVRKGD